MDAGLAVPPWDELVNTPPSREDPFTVCPSGVSTDDCTADVQGHKVGSSAFPPSVVQETPHASSSVHALPMWPPA